jgi:hypothetical protein
LWVFSRNFFYFFLPSFAFSSLHLPSFAFIGEGSEKGFGGHFGRHAHAGWAGWSRVRLAPLPAAMARRTAGGEMDCAYVSHA